MSVRIVARKYYVFLPDYARWAVAQSWRVEAASADPTHVIFLFADHFEPGHDASGTRQWIARYRALADRHHDHAGHRLQHTWFYPGEQHATGVLRALTEPVRDGYGEVELHYDHGFVDDVVEGIVLLRKGADSDSTLQAIRAKVQELNDRLLPPGVKIVPFVDRSDLVHYTTHTVLHNLAEGIILVVIVLFIFLGNARGALVVALTIPFSLLLAAICLNLREIPANLHSLGALDFGMVVDGAVVMVENIVRHPSTPRLASTSFAPHRSMACSFVRVSFKYGVDYNFAYAQAWVAMQQNVSLPGNVASALARSEPGLLARTGPA